MVFLQRKVRSVQNVVLLLQRNVCCRQTVESHKIVELHVEIQVFFFYVSLFVQNSGSCILYVCDARTLLGFLQTVEDDVSMSPSSVKLKVQTFIIH